MIPVESKMPEPKRLQQQGRAAKRSLLSDDTGALMVLGIVMGALLVGALWHVASIGDAVIWRERSQDAADAAAFQNAVWNARGMNVVVMLNIIMAAVMAFLVILRTMIMIVGGLTAIAAVACLLIFVPNPVSPIACSITGHLGRLTNTLMRWDAKAADKVVKITHAFGTAQRVVASGFPIVSIASSIDDTNDAYRNTTVWTLSPSIVPSTGGGGFSKRAIGFDCDVEEKPVKPRGEFLKGAWSSRMGYGASLPVQQDRWPVLCEKAGEFVPNNLAAILERMNAPSALVSGFDTVADFFGKVTGAFPAAFCAPGGANLESYMSPGVTQMSEDICNTYNEPKFYTTPNGMSEYGYPRPDPDNPGDYLMTDLADKFDLDKCIEDQNRKQQAKMPKVDGRKPTCSKPAKVWDYAQNGNLAMQSFSYIHKDPEMLSRDDKGLEVADGARTGNVQEVEAPWVRAQAEMYYDCTGWWQDCRSDAMWTLNWRARLRRVQEVSMMTIQFGEGAAIEMIINGLYKYAGRKLEDSAAGAGAPELLSTNAKDTWATAQYRDVVRDVGHGANEHFSVGKLLMTSPPSGTIVVH